MRSLLFFCLAFVLAVQSLEVRVVTKNDKGGPIHRSSPHSSSISLDDATFDFYMLVLQWNPKLSTTIFTIHGLWPENKDGTYPENCPGPKFNTTAISGLISKLNVVWPSSSGSNTNFWQHEWEKHGTCSEFGENAYFQNTINLHAKYDVKAALANSKIVPNQAAKYSKADIVNSITTNFGANPALKCTSSALVEIALCITKGLALMACPTTLGSYFTCPTTGITYY